MLAARDKYEEEINIFKLIWYCFSHWKSILAIGLMGIILGCGYVVMSGAVDEVVETPGATQIKEEQIIMEQLYKYSEERVDNLQSYVDGTKLMSLNPYDMYRGEVSCKIKAPQTEIGAINGAIYAYVINGKMFTDLETATGVYCARDFSQLIGINQQYTSATVLSNQDVQGVINLVISVYGESKEQTQLLISEIEHLIEEYLVNVQNNYTISEYKVLETVVVEAQSTVLADYQDRIRSKLSNEKDSLKNAKTTLESLQNTEMVITDDNVGIKKSDLVLYAAVGFVVGCIIAIVVWLAAFFLAGKLYMVSHLENRFGVRLLGTIHDFGKLKGLDSWIAQKRGGVYSSLSVEAQRAIVLLNIKNELSKAPHIKKLFMVSTLGNNCKEASILIDGLMSAGVTIEGCENVIGRTDVLERIAQCDAVLVLESNQNSKITLVEEEISILRKYVDVVLGMVVLGNKA